MEDRQQILSFAEIYLSNVMSNVERMKKTKQTHRLYKTVWIHLHLQRVHHFGQWYVQFVIVEHYKCMDAV